MHGAAAAAEDRAGQRERQADHDAGSRLRVLSATEILAIGADGAPAGWVAACLHADAPARKDATLWETRLHLCADIDELAGLRGDSAAKLAIDVPIGLPSSAGYRPCDLEARKLLRKVRRAESVFAPPARYMLEAAGDYATIRQLVEEERRRDPAAKGISAQSAAIAPKIKEVDAWVRARRESEEWLFECHPELSWYSLTGGHALLDKRSGSGLVQRLRLVRELFDDAEEQIAASPWTGRQAALSDLLDAYAALSTAILCARGEQEELGDGARDAEGLPMRMAM